MKGTLVQIAATFIISVPIFLGSFALAWPSYTLQLLESDESPLGFKITKEDGNWIGSVVMLGGLLSTFSARFISENIGRKRTSVLSGFLIMLGWSIIATAKTVTQILIGRFTTGLCFGLHVVTAVVYISEISETSIRGTLPSIMTFMYNMGSLTSYIVGWVCSYDVINYLCLSMAVGFLLLLFLLKETPSYLIGRGLEKKALESLKYYRGKSTVTQDLLDELNYIRNQKENNITTNHNNMVLLDKNGETEKFNQDKVDLDVTETEQSTWSILLSSKSSQRALITLVILMILSVFMGMLGVQVYAGQFFALAAPNLSPHLCSVLLALVITTVSGVSVLTMDLVPRRVLMMSTSASSGACLVALASLLRWAWAPEWVIPLVMLLYCVCYTLGGTNIIMVQTSECFSPQIKSFATSVIMGFMFIANFVVLYLFGPCVIAFGLDGAFFMFAILNFVAGFLTFLLMKETRRVPFEVIRSMFEEGYLYRKCEIK